MPDWVDALKKHPDTGQEVLIFCQGYDVTGTHYWSDFELAIFDRDFEGSRPFEYYQSANYRVEVDIRKNPHPRNIWKHRGVTHWMPLPAGPPQISKEAYAKLAGYEYEKPKKVNYDTTDR